MRVQLSLKAEWCLQELFILDKLVWLLISLVLGVYSMTFEGKMRKLSDQFRIKLGKGGGGKIPLGGAKFVLPPSGKSHATPLVGTGYKRTGVCGSLRGQVYPPPKKKHKVTGPCIKTQQRTPLSMHTCISVTLNNFYSVLIMQLAFYEPSTVKINHDSTINFLPNKYDAHCYKPNFN